MAKRIFPAALFLMAAACAGETETSLSDRARPPAAPGNPLVCGPSCCKGRPGPQLTVTVTGVRSGAGNVRVTVYPGERELFLSRGKGIVKVDAPSRAGRVDLCVPLPGPGAYALAVMHDIDADGKADKFSEGFGFSNNASFGFGPPAFDDALFYVEEGERSMAIALDYPFG